MKYIAVIVSIPYVISSATGGAVMDLSGNTMKTIPAGSQIVFVPQTPIIFVPSDAVVVSQK